MSTGSTSSSSKLEIPLERARLLASVFATLYIPLRCARFVAGSIRRQKPLVGDIEIVYELCEASLGLAHLRDQSITRDDDGGLFAGPSVEAVPWRIIKWGDRYQQVEHREHGYCVDLFGADLHNFGSILLIRTGPAAFSRAWMTRLLDHGKCHLGGYVRELTPSSAELPTVVSCPTEERAFELAGMAWIPPEERG